MGAVTLPFEFFERLKELGVRLGDLVRIAMPASFFYLRHQGINGVIDLVQYGNASTRDAPEPHPWVHHPRCIAPRPLVSSFHQPVTGTLHEHLPIAETDCEQRTDGVLRSDDPRDVEERS
jgi:hypothetical protein